MCGCNEYVNSGVIVDAMKSKCVMYYLNIPFVLFKFFFFFKSNSYPKQDKVVLTFPLKSMLAKKGYAFLSAISDGHLN